MMRDDISYCIPSHPTPPHPAAAVGTAATATAANTVTTMLSAAGGVELLLTLALFLPWFL